VATINTNLYMRRLTHAFSLIAILLVLGCTRGTRETVYVVVEGGITFPHEAQVAFEGQTIGTIDPTPVVNGNRFRIALRVPASKFSDSDVFSVKQNGLLGGAYIEITRGNTKGTPLKNGAIIRALSSIQHEKIPAANMQFFADMAAIADLMKDLPVEKRTMLLKEIKGMAEDRVNEFKKQSLPK
jgi:hypothetical protein